MQFVWAAIQTWIYISFILRCIHCTFGVKALVKKKTIEPCPNTIENVMDLMVIMGIVLVLMETIMCLLVCDVFYWWDVKSNWKNPQNTLQNGILKMVSLEKANGL